MFLMQNSRRVTICFMDMLDLCGRVGFCANFCWTMWMEGSTGTEVNRALTSNDVITSPVPTFGVDLLDKVLFVF